MEREKRVLKKREERGNEVVERKKGDGREREKRKIKRKI